VVGVPDEEWGESVHAVVQLLDGRPFDAGVEAALVAFAGTHLAGPQRPRSFSSMGELPRTETGKLARRNIRDPFWRGKARRI
jgi:long-chain acyl-CoA synthetase